MKSAHNNPSSSRTAKRVMALLIAVPLVFTLIMWSVLPSGYERQFCKKGIRQSVISWQPLQAGLKYVITSMKK
ncbi:MAG: hypothetical protein MUE99_00320 [Chitinophagaceae bacterium]|nr:hypothetical protein [Chitinophagaceae bacterium]